ncbi:hypothetical protein V461_03935 [Pantoea ananatis BRT98]|uniref:hypothetical protein n=1 Tax=Pantoea ananas TaxID=553 RepID=UPI001EE6169F|nr:hypothetical protein [Pantoea ananatis]PKC46702.1 hypothetical protein V461_03935 [Pantoea ananatis BRT98]
MIKFFCLCLMLMAWGLYSIQFGFNFLSSQAPDVWGQFGDFMGGVLNPILSFISICLLIKSVTLQVQSNKGLQKEIRRQENLEDYKKYEVRFFSLLSAQDSNFEKFRILLEDDSTQNQKEPDGQLSFSPVSKEYRSGNAVTYIDDCLCVLVNAGTEKDEVISWLEDLDVDDHCFSIARRFYLIVKLIDDKVGDDLRNEELDLLINLTDEKILTMIVILTYLYDWDVLKLIGESGIIKKAGFGDYIKNYKNKA